MSSDSPKSSNEPGSPPSSAPAIQKLATIVLWSTLGIVIIGLAAAKYVLHPPATTVPPTADLSGQYAAPAFALFDQEGLSFSAADLRGKPYVCDFIFTTCGSVCPAMTKKMADLQQLLPPDVALVSITVNPEHDSPAVLKAYGTVNGANFARWHFLTGPPATVYQTIAQMKIGVETAHANAPIIHSEKFLLVDGQGNVVNNYNSNEADAAPQLIADATVLTHPWWHRLPAVNASLNGLSAFLLVWAFVMVKRHRYTVHAALVIAAFISSAVFLASYLLYHGMKSRHGELVTTFPQSAVRPWYLALLGSHTLLAVVILPLIFRTFYLAWKQRWSQHHKIASITFPLWLYVSITGVAVYVMLYHVAAHLK